MVCLYVTLTNYSSWDCQIRWQSAIIDKYHETQDIRFRLLSALGMVGRHLPIYMPVGVALDISRSPIENQWCPWLLEKYALEIITLLKWWVASYRWGQEIVGLINLSPLETGCLNGNLWYHRWRRGCRTGNVLFSVIVILNMLFLYVYLASECNENILSSATDIHLIFCCGAIGLMFEYNVVGR